MAQYRVLMGIDYLDKRAEADDVVDDIPEQSIEWLIECGAIEVVKEATIPDNIDAQLPPIATPPPAVPNADQLTVTNTVPVPVPVPQPVTGV